jgi:hypothetical protein
MKRIRIIHDSSPQNPFEDWDCEFPLMWDGGRNKGDDYSKGGIDKYLKYYLTDNQITRHLRKILSMIGVEWEVFNANYPLGDWTKAQRVDEVQEWLSEWLEESLNNRAEFCTEFGIKHYFGRSTGYSQGDCVDVFICWTPEYGETTGVKYKDVDDESLESSKKLFDNWMWGDVYGFILEECKSYAKIPMEKFKEGDIEEFEEEEEWEEIDSCWGFFGDKWMENGMSDHIPQELHEELKNFDYQKIEYDK